MHTEITTNTEGIMTYKSIETAPKTGETLALWKHGYEKEGWRLGHWCDEQQRWVESDGHTPINPEFYMELENPRYQEKILPEETKAVLDKLSDILKTEMAITDEMQRVIDVPELWASVTWKDCSILARYMCGGK